ncbi:amino acid adenylation domain-containing protein [Nonomuraea sp. NPDC052116]|uniref:non-ribosomal peptide synthetase n=1 Tax=Nonomuraea sp. NPDC052116 TaxID=3155665 RepID=UPI00341D0A93
MTGSPAAPGEPDAPRRAGVELSPEKRALVVMELARRHAARRPSIPALPRAAGETRLAASPAQERMFFLQELDADAVTYHVPIAMRLRGHLDAGALSRSVAVLVDRHEALRTGFAVDPVRGLEQVVCPAGEVPVDVAGGDVTAAEVPSRLDEFMIAPFDLSKPPLLRAGLWRVADAPGEEWILALCVHHIVVDGWSLGVLVDELSAAYGADIAGRDPGLPAVSPQYADFAAWQRERLATPEFEEHEAYWRARPFAADAAAIPADRPRPPGTSSPARSVPVELPADLVAALRQVGEAAEATPFMVLAAGLAATLCRWAGESGALIGTPVAGRPLPELERVVGCFVNTLPLLVEVDGAETCTRLLRRVRATCLDAYAHQDVPFERIVQDAGSGRRAGRSPLRTVLALGDIPLRPLELPGLEIERLEPPRATTDLDLSLELMPAADGSLTGVAVFAADVFDRATAERFVAGLLSVYAGAAAHPEGTVAALPLMAPAERDLLVERFSGAAAPAYPAGSFQERFSKQAAEHPHTVAVMADRDGGTGPELTYGELERRSTALAGWLRRRGVAAEDRIGVHLERGPDLLVAFLAVLKAGGTYVPLDPGQPAGRIEHVLRDSLPRLVLSSSDMIDRLPGGGPETVAVDRLTDLPSEEPAAPAALDGAAYVLYTSGSTGTPKGVVITHRGLHNRLRWMCDTFGFGPDDVVLHRTTIGFDASLWELCVPLMTGGRLVLAEPGRHGDPRYLLDVVGRHRVTACDFVPSLMRPVLDEPGVTERMATLRAVVSGGEELTPELARRFHEAIPQAALYNFYGPTEAAIDVSTYRVTAPVTAPVPIGTPIAGTELYVLDERLEPQPVGVPGELHVGGVQLARGYLGRPGQTADRFVPHPFRAGQRLYRTGDRARFRADGSLEYLGRLDAQVKIRGTRIEPAEVESALRGHPDVREAVVLARPGVRGDLELAAFLVLAAGTPPPAAEELRRFLGRVLSPAMIPASFTCLAAFPLTANGKVDAARLLAGNEGAALRNRPPVPPQDALQEVLLGMWAGQLDGGDLGVQDDFFELGGHSIMATLIVAQLRDLFGVDLPLHLFLDATTVARLAELVRTRAAEQGIDADRIADVILEVRRMPDAEVATQLLN